jgi:hypothetical protein
MRRAGRRAKPRVEELTWIAILWLASLGAFLHQVDCAPLIADDEEL